MRYAQVQEGRFLLRPNRFIAQVEVDGQVETCHVKNTGRCKELLRPGARVILARGENPGRRTKYDLIAVYKGGRLINMDSQAPNKAAAEYLGRLFPDGKHIRPEYSLGDSRLDFYLEREGHAVYLEVKGCTLEREGVALFPDAPTERGVKHLRHLTALAQEGQEAWVLFIIQMEGVRYFTPNDGTHPAFGQALREAAAAGVHILAVDCLVTPDSLACNQPVSVRLGPDPAAFAGE